jgi:hypothetical protein
MKIKYKVISSACSTKCPHPKLFKKNIYLPRVNSIACSNCEFFAGDNEEAQIIDCSYNDIGLDEGLFKI